MPLTADEIRTIARKHIAASAVNDTEALASLNAPDAKVWHNFDNTEVTSEQSARTLSWLHRTVDGLAWEETALLITDRGWVHQSVITGTGPGGTLRANTCVVITLDDDGKIVRTEEYLDPAQLSALQPTHDA